MDKNKVSELYWYAIKVRIGHEQKVAAAILAKATKLGLENVESAVFVDLVKGKKVVRYPGVVLLKTDDHNSESGLIANIAGVERYISRSPISNEEYEFMKKPPVTPYNELVEVGSKVEIINGAFATQIMIVDTIEGEQAKGLINIFGRETEVLVKIADLVTV